MNNKLHPIWSTPTIRGRLKTGGIGNEYKQHHENQCTNC
jgi:hypothetical protein